LPFIVNRFGYVAQPSRYIGTGKVILALGEWPRIA
jgi:hypothetical protein